MRGRVLFLAFVLLTSNVPEVSAQSYVATDQFGFVSNVIRIVPFRTLQPCPGAAAACADARGITLITVFDAAFVPVPFTPVTIDFGGCVEMQLGTPQVFQPAFGCPPGAPAPTVTAMTNAFGVAMFRIAGGFGGGPPINAVLPAPGAGLNCAAVSAVILGVVTPLGSITAAGPDLNGIGGLTVADLSILIADLVRQNGGGPGASVRGRSNLDGSIAVAPIAVPDLAVYLQYQFDSNIPPTGVPGAALSSPDC